LELQIRTDLSAGDRAGKILSRRSTGTACGLADTAGSVASILLLAIRRVQFQRRANPRRRGLGIRGQADDRLGKLLHAAVYFC
jgi:hypothetical protein